MDGFWVLCTNLLWCGILTRGEIGCVWVLNFLSKTNNFMNDILIWVAELLVFIPLHSSSIIVTRVFILRQFSLIIETCLYSSSIIVMGVFIPPHSSSIIVTWVLFLSLVDRREKFYHVFCRPGELSSCHHVIFQARNNYLHSPSNIALFQKRFVRVQSPVPLKSRRISPDRLSVQLLTRRYRIKFQIVDGSASGASPNLFRPLATNLVSPCKFCAN